MYKKSTIQQQIEINELKGKLANAIETFIDKYTVDDIVFGLVNGTPQEVIKGFSDILKSGVLRFASSFFVILL